MLLGLTACFVLGAAALLLLLALPWSLCGPLGRAVGVLAGRVLRVRRHEVEARIRAAGIARETEVADGMYTSLGIGLIELLWTAAPGPRELGARLRLTPRAEQLLQSRVGQGAIIATAHVGNWDLAACAVAERMPLYVVSKRLKVRWLDAIWQRLRARRGVRLVPVRGAVKGSMAALSEGAFVAMIIDQSPDRPTGSVSLPFFAQAAWHDLAPAMIAARAKKPLVLALGRRCDDGSHEVDIPLYLEPPERADRVWIDQATLQLAQALEAFIKQQPEQWLWLHRRWKPLPAGRAR